MSEQYKEKKYPIPGNTPVDAFPNYVRSECELNREKHALLEDQYKRKQIRYEYCDAAKLAFKLCARNMNDQYAQVACRMELEDLSECEHSQKRAERHKKLLKASKMVGDRIPELSSSFHSWLY